MQCLNDPGFREIFNKGSVFHIKPHTNCAHSRRRSHRCCARHGAPRLRALHPCALWPLARWRPTAHSCRSTCTGSPWNPGVWTEIVDVSLEARLSISCSATLNPWTDLVNLGAEITNEKSFRLLNIQAQRPKAENWGFKHVNTTGCCGKRASDPS